jgi:hypothetical protein
VEVSNPNGRYHLFPSMQLRQRTLEVLQPILERAMEAPFEDQEVQIELGNFHNQVWCMLQADT